MRNGGEWVGDGVGEWEMGVGEWGDEGEGDGQWRWVSGGMG